MNNEFSFESIFNAGVGNKPVYNKSNLALSEEKYDGYFDSVIADLTRSEEELNFLDDYIKVSDYNTMLKMKMLNKINREYGKCARGIENYIRSCEAEETDGTSALKEDTNNNDKSNDKEEASDSKDPEKNKKFVATWKHAKWLQTALHAIGQFFVKIWKAIKGFFVKIANTFKNAREKSKAKKAAKQAEKNLKKNEKAASEPAASNFDRDGAIKASRAENKAENNKVLTLIANVSKGIDQITPYVNNLSLMVGRSIKLDESKYKRSNEYIKKLKFINEVNIIGYSSMKLLNKLSQMVMSAGQEIMKQANAPQNLKIVGNGDFDNYRNMFISSVKNIEDLFKKSIDINAKLDAIEMKKDYGTDINKDDINVLMQRNGFMKDIYNFYDTVSKMCEKYVNFKPEKISHSDITNENSSNKDMSKVLSKVVTGLGEAIGDEKIRKRILLKNLFGVEVIG